MMTYRSDTNFLSNVWDSVYVNFVESHVRVIARVGHLFEDGGNHTAWAAPSRPEIEDSRSVLADLLALRHLSIVARYMQ